MAASGVPIILCFFMETFTDVLLTFIDLYICCFPVKEKQETYVIHRTEI